MKNFIFWAVYLAGCDFLSVSILLLSVWWQIKHYSINFCNNTKRLLCELVLNIYKLFKTSFGLYVFMGYRKRSVVWNGFIMEVTKICQKLTELLALEILENKKGNKFVFHLFHLVYLPTYVLLYQTSEGFSCLFITVFQKTTVQFSTTTTTAQSHSQLFIKAVEKPQHKFEAKHWYNLAIITIQNPCINGLCTQLRLIFKNIYNSMFQHRAVFSDIF